MRVNARLDDAHTRKLDELCQRTGRSRTDVLRAAIDHYHAQQVLEPPPTAAILAEHGFIGCGEGDPDLAQDYKRQIAVSLRQKAG